MVAGLRALGESATVAQSKTKIGVATIPTYPDAEVWVTDTDPVSGRGGGHFLPANADAVRGVRFAGLVVRRSDATPELLTAFPGQDEVDYARECVEERAQLSLS